MSAELTSSKGNPFCVLQVKNFDGTKTEGRQLKTAIIQKEINPCWNEGFMMYVTLLLSIISVLIFSIIYYCIVVNHIVAEKYQARLKWFYGLM